MDIESGNFDKAKAICYLAHELEALVGRVAALEGGAPSSAGEAGEPELYLGGEISERIHRALISAGFLTNADVAAASDEELLAVRGVGSATMGEIRAALG